MSGRLDEGRIDGRRRRSVRRARRRGVLGRLGLAASLIAGVTVTAVVAGTPSIAGAADPVVSLVRPTLQSNDPIGIAMSADGVIWNIGPTTGPLWRIEPASFPSFGRPNPLNDITLGSDGSLWVTESGDCVAGRGCISRVFGPSATPAIQPFADPTIVEPQGITTGPDGALWFTNENTVAGTHSVGRRLPTGGAVSSFPVTLPSGGRLNAITAGPDGNLWFTNQGTGPTFSNSSIGRITPAGAVTLFTDPLIVNPQGITTGPDGNLWFTNLAGNSIGRITTSGVVTGFTDASISGPVDIVGAADGALWFTNSTGNSIGRITAAGAVTSYTDASVSRPWAITQGPGGDLFFTNRTTASIGKVDLPSYTVNSTLDDPDVTPGDDVCLTTTGSCTLRAAIQESNAHTGRDLITFDIAGPGEAPVGFGEASPHIIRVVQQDPQIAGYAGLPLITDPVTIDGFTQPGSYRNNLIKDDNTARRIRIQSGMTDAALNPFNPPALPVGNQRWPMGLAIGATAPGTEVRGIAIGGFAYNSFVGQAGIDMYVGGANSRLEGMTFSSAPVGLFVDTTGTGTTIGGARPDAHNSFFGNGANANLNANNLTFSGNSVLAGWDVSIKLNNMANTLIGGTAPGAGNIFYDYFGGAGECTINETFFSSSGTRILGNTFGLLPDGVTPDAAGPRTCTVLLRGSGAVVGDGTAAGRNVFAATRGSSALTPGPLSFYGANTVVRGNYFGTDVTGTVARPNNSAAIFIGSTPSQIGGNAPGDGNLIANGTQGVVVGAGRFGARIVGNSIYDNGDNGITLEAGSNNAQDAPVISSVSMVGQDLAIDYSLADGAPPSAYPAQIDVYLADSAASGEGRTFVGRAVVAGPGVGSVSIAAPVATGSGFVVATATDASGNTSQFSPPAALPIHTVNSTNDGPDVNLSDNECLTATSGECTLRAAIEQSNAHPGSAIIRFAIPGGGVQTISPSAPLPNITGDVTIDGYTQAGAAVNTSANTSNATITVRLDGSAAGVATSGLVLNAPSTVRGLAISGFSAKGIIAGFQTHLEGNFIGIGPDGTTPAGNGEEGVYVSGGSASVFGGATIASRNVISGNGDDGIRITGIAVDNVVSGNLIGTDRTGTIAVPNLSGVCSCTFGGAGNHRIERNLLSGNSAAGIYIAANGTVILGNTIGTAVSGLSALPNGRGGVVSGSSSTQTQIGDGTAAGRNVISGNLSEGGISLGSSTEANVQIRGNYIGVGADGTTPIGNSQGITLFSFSGTRGTIGGVGGENVIANNVGPGVRVDSGTGIRISRNSIFDNGGLGILLGAGPANDLDDADTGPNNLQNSPEIISADLAAGDLELAVSIDSLPTNAVAPIEIDFYVADSAISGEGQRYIGSVTQLTTPGGQTLSLGNLTGVAAGDSIVATATDANGNTSPFSASATVGGGAPPTISLDFGVASGSSNTVNIAPTGVRVADLDRTAIAGAGGAGAIASSSITAIGPEDTALAEISIGSTPLRAVVLNSAPLRAVPLVDIVVDPPGGGGWTSLLAGTPLENVPLVNLTFGDALSNPIVEGKIAALPLRAVEVDGTPLRAVPLAAIVLGSTPLRGVPLRGVAQGQPNPWCAVIASILVAPQTCDQALDTLNLMEVALRGAPLRGVDLSSIPLRGVNLAGTPLRGVPLRGVDLNASPLRGVPLRGVDLNAADLAGVPLRGVPLRAVPLRGVPLRAVDLQTAPLRGVGTNLQPQASPLRAVLVEGLSVDGAPLRGVPLRGVPLRGVDLEASPLRGVPLRDVPLRGVPLNAINIDASPLRGVPLRGVDLVGSPLAAVPLRGVDLAQSPLRGVPLRGVPLRGVPLRGVPIGALTLGPTPLRGVPLRGVDILSSPLRGVPLRGVPLRGVDVPGSINCALVDCVKGTLGDALLAGAVPSTFTVGDIIDATAGIRLSDIAPYFREFTEAQVAAALANSTLTFGDLVTLDDMVLGDLPLDRPEFATLVLGDLGNALSLATLGDLIGAEKPAGGRYTESELQSILNSWTLTIGQLTDPGNLTMGDLFDASTGPVYLSDLGSLLDYLNVGQLIALVPGLETQVRTMSETLGDLTPQQLGRMTLGDLGAAASDVTIGTLLAGLGGLLDQYTLGDLLLALVDPGSLAYGGVEFDSFDEKTLPPGTVGAATFNAAFTLGGVGAQNVTVEVALPSSATYVPGTAVVRGTPQEPTQVGQTLVWPLIANAGPAPVPVRFDVLPALRLGPTTLTATARVLGTGVSAASTATVTVAEGTEPNDFRLETGSTTVRQTTPALEDVAYLTYIPTATDIDVYEITLAENDRLVAQLSNLDADLDIVVWGRPTNASTAAALSPVSAEAPLVPITDPDADGADASVINDFVRLDALDPTLRLIASSNTSGNTDETISTDRLPAGRYFIQVYGANGATNVAPASLQLKIRPGDALPPCRATGPLPARVGTPSAPTIPASANTLILTNETRLQQLHSATARANVTAATNRLTSYLAANPQLGVNPVVVPVDAHPTVRAAYDAWDLAPGSCDPNAANAVVAAINTSIIDPRRSQFQYIVFLGGDDLIPMARIADGTTVANEYDFRNEFDGILAGGTGAGRNAVSAPFWESMIRSDEPYGDAAARRSGEGYLYVSDAALGRVVETPAEIVKALDTFVRFGGNLSIETATVLGYDFLSDGSEEVADELAPLPVDRALASGRNASGALWDKTDATAKLQAAGTRALVSLNAHFDYYRALPAVGDQVPGFDDNLIATAVETALGPNALEQSLVFSMGCHSGLSVSDVLVGSPNSDWAQTLGREGALLIGNTGFGYGDTEAVAYTEELMRLFADRVTSPFALPLGPSSSSSTVGQALTWAKNDFVAGLQSYSVYDKKAVMESTFYGLPFYRVGLTPAALPPTPTRTAGADGTGTSTSRVLATPTNATVTTPSGTYPANVDGAQNELVIVAPGRPIQPRLVQDISVVSPTDSRSLAQVAHGAIVEDMTSVYTGVTNPVIATPVFDASASQPEPDAGDVAFPTKPIEITTATGPSGQRQQLVLATGQYRSDTSVQRLDSNLDVVVYYAGPAVTDFTAPTIGAVDSQIAGGRLSISTTVSDAARIDRVYVLVVQNPGFGPATWTGVDLVRSGTTDRWTGSLVLALSTTDVEFIVQAKDNAGNVGFATNKARNFDVDQPVAPPTPPPTPPAQVLTAAAATAPGATGIYGGTVEIVVASNAAATYSIDGATPVPVPTSGRFTIAGEGFHTWEVTVPSGYAIIGSVLIDTSAPFVASDRASGAVQLNTPVTLTAGDGGAGVASITYSATGANTIVGTTVNATSASLVLTAAGTTTVTVVATDAVGNTSAPRSFTYLVSPPNAAPTVRADMGIAGLEEIGFQTNAVVINGTFSDPGGPGPFTASVRWVAGGAFTPLVLNNNSQFVAAFIYGSAGIRTATVRICDAGGACGIDDIVVRTSVTQRITPVRQCVVDRGASASPRYQARWGYNNPAPFAIAIPSIPILENTFTSVPYLRGQPQILLPGNKRDVFTTTFASGTSTWRINGNTASALSSSPRC